VTILGIDHVQLAAPPGCEAQARDFYGRLLDLPEIDKPESLQGRGGAWFRCGSQQLHVGVQQPFLPAEKAHPALSVAPGGLDALAARLQEASSKVDWDASLHPLRRFYTRDPWGNRIELLEAPPTPGGR
jgi:catechol 2,3-dioxygenase-like lactoylglutathione lyase family enzyme